VLLSNYSFNNQEHDDEMYGDGNAISFDARILDSRLGRWLSIDPLFAKYPSLSPYSFVANSPLIMVDLDGKDIIIWYKKGTEYVPYKYDPAVNVEKAPAAVRKTVEALKEIHAISTISVQPTVGYDASNLTPMQVVDDLAKSEDFRLNIVPIDLETWEKDKAINSPTSPATTYIPPDAKGATIVFSDEIGTYEIDAQGNKTGLERNVVGILAHEIKHAHTTMIGKRAELKNSPDADFQDLEEKAAVVFENTVSLNRTNTVDRKGERNNYTNKWVKVKEKTINSTEGTKIMTPNRVKKSPLPNIPLKFSKSVIPIKAPLKT